MYSDNRPAGAPPAALLLAAVLLLVANTLVSAAVTCPSGGNIVPLASGADLKSAVNTFGLGKTYQLAPGNYTISDQIFVNSSTTCFIGSSPDQVVVNVGPTTAFQVKNAGTILSLQGLTLVGQGSQGVYADGGSVDIRNVVLQNFLEALTCYAPVEDVSLTSVSFRSNGVGGNSYAACHLEVGARSLAWHEVEFSHNRGIGLSIASTTGATSLNISGSAVFRNNAERAIYIIANRPVQLTFTGNATFLDNTGPYSGGAIALYALASATFTGSLLMKNNNAAMGSGGAIALLYGASLVASGPTFLLNNMAGGDGGALYVYTLPAGASDTAASFLGLLVVQGNTAQGDGGAFYLNGRNNVTYLTYVTLAGESVFANNTATSTAGAVGGAVAVVSNAIFQVTGSGSMCIQGNTATTSGGGIYSTAQVLLNSSNSNMDNNSPDDIFIAAAGSVKCPGANPVLNSGTYHITGQVCSCVDANNGSSTCGCPAGYLWEAASCSCELNNVCGNVTDTGVPYQCTGNWVYNPAAANNTELSTSSCCLWAATCKSGYIESNRACERGVYNRSADNQLNPSLYTCCQDSCADSNIRSSPARPWQCTRGAYDASKARSPKPANSVCCQPTCGDTNTSSPTPIRYNCTGQWQVNPLSANVTVLSNESCCTLNAAKLSVQLNTSAAVVAVGDLFNLTVTVAVAGPTGAAAAEVAVKVVIPNGLSVANASLPAGCATTEASTVVCGLGSIGGGASKSVVIRAAAAAAGSYAVNATASSPSVTADPSSGQATAEITVQGACCSSTTGLCQAAATAAGCVGGSFLQDKSCATAACPAPPTGPANFTITRTTSLDAKNIAVGDVVGIELVLGAGNAAANTVKAQVSVTGRVQFAGTPTLGTRAAGCKIQALTPRNKKTGVTQRLSCPLGSMQQGQTKSLKFSFTVLEAGAATIRSRVASTSSSNQDVLTFTSLGGCCLPGSNTKSPSCSDMTLAACKAAGGKASTKQRCAQAKC